MENAHKWNSNVFYKQKMLQVKNENQLVSISFQTLPYWTCLGIKMKTELYAASVTDTSFHFSELGCYAVTHPLNTFLPCTRKIFLPLTGGPYKPSLPLPSSPPQNQNLTSMSSAFSNIFPVFFCHQKWVASPASCNLSTHHCNCVTFTAFSFLYHAPA